MKKKRKKKRKKKKRKRKKRKKRKKKKRGRSRSRVLDPVRHGEVGLAHLQGPSPTRRQQDILVSRLECTNPGNAWCESRYSH